MTWAWIYKEALFQPRPCPSLYVIQLSASSSSSSKFSMPGGAYVSHRSCRLSSILLMQLTPHFGQSTLTTPCLFLNPTIFAPQLRQCRIMGFHPSIQGFPPFPAGTSLDFAYLRMQGRESPLPKKGNSCLHCLLYPTTRGWCRVQTF